MSAADKRPKPVCPPPWPPQELWSEWVCGRMTDEEFGESAGGKL